MKKAKKIFEGHIKDQIAKKWFFMYFFAIIWSNGLENSANVFGLTFKAINTKKATILSKIGETCGSKSVSQKFNENLPVDSLFS